MSTSHGQLRKWICTHCNLPWLACTPSLTQATLPLTVVLVQCLLVVAWRLRTWCFDSRRLAFVRCWDFYAQWALPSATASGVGTSSMEGFLRGGLKFDKVCIEQDNIADDLLTLPVNVMACQRCLCSVDARLQLVSGASGSSSRCWPCKSLSRAWRAIQYEAFACEFMGYTSVVVLQHCVSVFIHSFVCLCVHMFARILIHIPFVFILSVCCVSVVFLLRCFAFD